MVELSKKFVRLFIKGNKELAKKHKAEICPYLVVLDSKGKEHRVFQKRELNGIAPEDLKAKLEEALKALVRDK